MAAIANAAVAEFLENGYEGASMDGIARRSGLTKGGLYHHFAGKDALLIFANQQLAQPVADILSEACRCPSPADGLARYIRAYLRFWSARPRQMEFSFLTMTKLREMPEARHAYAAYYRETVRALADLYRNAIDAGELSHPNPEGAALALTAALDGTLGLILIDEKHRPGSSAAFLQDIFVRAFQTVTPREPTKTGPERGRG